MKSLYSGNSGVLVREYKGGLIAIILPISPIGKIYRASLKKEKLYPPYGRYFYQMELIPTISLVIKLTQSF